MAVVSCVGQCAMCSEASTKVGILTFRDSKPDHELFVHSEFAMKSTSCARAGGDALSYKHMHVARANLAVV
jgi:hypothetical protein